MLQKLDAELHSRVDLQYEDGDEEFGIPRALIRVDYVLPLKLLDRIDERLARNSSQVPLGMASGEILNEHCAKSGGWLPILGVCNMLGCVFILAWW